MQFSLKLVIEINDSVFIKKRSYRVDIDILIT